MPLPLARIQAILAQSKSRKTARLILALFLLHADGLGFVMVPYETIARAANYESSRARKAIYELEALGEVERIRKGTGHVPPWWHISAVTIGHLAA